MSKKNKRPISLCSWIHFFQISYSLQLFTCMCVGYYYNQKNLLIFYLSSAFLLDFCCPGLISNQWVSHVAFYFTIVSDHIHVFIDQRCFKVTLIWKNYMDLLQISLVQPSHPCSAGCRSWGSALGWSVYKRQRPSYQYPVSD